VTLKYNSSTYREVYLLIMRTYTRRCCLASKPYKCGSDSQLFPTKHPWKPCFV